MMMCVMSAVNHDLLYLNILARMPCIRSYVPSPSSYLWRREIHGTLADSSTSDIPDDVFSKRENAALAVWSGLLTRSASAKPSQILSPKPQTLSPNPEREVCGPQGKGLPDWLPAAAASGFSG